MKFASRWRTFWDRRHDELSAQIDRIPEKLVGRAVFLAAAVSLFAEMVIVRWHTTCFHAFAIFKNVSLLSCFLGLAIGYGLSNRKRIALAAVLPLLAFQSLLFGILSNTNLGGRRFNPVAEQLVMGSDGTKWTWLDAVEGNAILAVVFVLNALMFVPLGQLAGRLMARMPRIQSYSLNLLGSLAGIGLFFLLSLAWTGPAVWLGVTILLLTPFLLGRTRALALGVVSTACVVIAAGAMNLHHDLVFYSPYQVISLRLPQDDNPVPSMSVQVNHCFYQDVFDCRPAAVAASDKNAEAAAYYNLPYQLRPAPGDVLVVGAGTGNDVAAALRNGGKSVTAVEIDPAILFLGRKLHPERVYHDSRTHAEVNDARSFLRQTDRRFDTIVYGLLDSHTNLGAMTNVRLDSFVYTVEGFRDAAQRLTDNGVLVVSYLVLHPTQGARLFAMLQQADSTHRPRAFHNRYGGVTFVTGPGLDKLGSPPDTVLEATSEFLKQAVGVEVATDDWPFFYMKARSYPVSYAVMVLILLGISGVMVKKQLGGVEMRSARGLTFFFLGAGFMLVETKGITELGLTLGNTWAVMALVVSGILLMVYAANQWVARYGAIAPQKAFLMLGGSLALGFFVTWLNTRGVTIPFAKVVMPVVLTLPLFFAGLIFSGELARGGEIGGALSANLFGAMLGGFLEYNSMYFGYLSLYPLGMALYAAAYACHRRIPATGSIAAIDEVRAAA